MVILYIMLIFKNKNNFIKMNKNIKIIIESLLDDISADMVSTISDDYEQLDKMIIDKIKSLPNNRTHINFYDDTNNVILLTQFYNDITLISNIINSDDLSMQSFRLDNCNNNLNVEILTNSAEIPCFIIHFNHTRISSVDVFSEVINTTNLIVLLKQIACKQLNFICNKNKFVIAISNYNNLNILTEKDIKFYNIESTTPLYYTEIKPTKVEFIPIAPRIMKITDDAIMDILTIFNQNGIVKYRESKYNSNFKLEEIIKQFCIDNKCEYIEAKSVKIDNIFMHMNELLYSNKLNININKTVAYDIQKQSTGKDKEYGKYSDYIVKIECYNKQNKYGYIILTYRYYNSSLLQLINTEEKPYN